jgi:hypothetical protein
MSTESIDDKLIKLLFGKDGLEEPDGSSVMGMIRGAQEKSLQRAKDLIKQSQVDLLERVGEGLVDKPENTFDEDYVNGWNNCLDEQREALLRIKEGLK